MSFTVLIVAALIASTAIILVPFLWSLRAPKNNPAYHIKSREQKDGQSEVVVLVGDSITHGKMGFNFVDLVSEKYHDRQFEFVNAGRNGELAWNVVQRLDDIIKCEPDIVTVMIGTNDAKGALTEAEMKGYVRRMKLPRKPSHDWFRENLQILINRLKSETHARIALLSIPPLGEDPNHPAFAQSTEYSKTVEEVSRETNVTYLPLHEKMIERLSNNAGMPNSSFEKAHFSIVKATYKHYLLRRSWNRIAKEGGFQLLVDHIHLNREGAIIAAELVEGFIGN
ncbi:MAG: SGNH/GDSL hydrolase family protein [Candidatus Thorarchaeota archaeon]|jgi:lysophospholipase L1-like esterase